MRIETSKEHKELKIPEFLSVVKEVTHDDVYSSQTMADIDYKMPANDKKEIKESLGKTEKSQGSNEKKEVKPVAAAKDAKPAAVPKEVKPVVAPKEVKPAAPN